MYDFEAWRNTPGKCRCDSLKKGEKFEAINGKTYTFDHDHHGCCYVVADDGTPDMFAGCASVKPKGREGTKCKST